MNEPSSFSELYKYYSFQTVRALSLANTLKFFSSSHAFAVPTNVRTRSREIMPLFIPDKWKLLCVHHESGLPARLSPFRRFDSRFAAVIKLVDEERESVALSKFIRDRWRLHTICPLRRDKSRTFAVTSRKRCVLKLSNASFNDT